MASIIPGRLAGNVSAVSRPPTPAENALHRGFSALATACAVGIIVLVFAIVYQIARQAVPAMVAQGPGFLTRSVWNASTNEFGILPEIWGTLYSSLLALLIGGFFGVTVAIFLTQDFLPARLAAVFRTIVEMLAAIPSVVFGLWGIFVVIPLIRPAANWLHDTLGWIPFFGTSLSGPGLFPAALVLAIMILPTVAAISQDALHQIPYKVKEAAYGMGTTRWEAILKVLLPTASGGIFSGLVLGFGRALGETMALAMLIGNANQISLSLFAPANTLASLMASNFPEAGGTERDALMFAGLTLLAVTLAVNVIGSWLRARTQRQDQS
ncbi:MAG: phosphate ABC transporter permease subunit PstC [Geminicoccaceae bacterium]